MFSNLIFQILFFLAYNIVNGLNRKEYFLQYDLFEVVEMTWLIVASIVFLKNVTENFKIGEMLPFKFCVITINIYILSKIIVSSLTLLRTKGDDTHQISGYMVIIQYSLLGIGLIGFVVSTICYLSLTPLVTASVTDKIFFHIEGNTILFESFMTVTTIRGILKLDTLINLEFFTCLIFILLEQQVFAPEHEDNTHIGGKFHLEYILPWVISVLLFLLIVYANYIAANSTVSTILSCNSNLLFIYRLSRPNADHTGFTLLSV